MREPDEYPDHDAETFRVRWPVVATIITWVVGLALVYANLNAKNDVQDNRLQNLEYNQRLMVDDVREIKSDIKQLLRQQQP